MDLNRESMRLQSPEAYYDFLQMTSNILMPEERSPSSENNTLYLMEEMRRPHESPEEEALECFWNQQMNEIDGTRVFKSSQNLPLARIKRVMKSKKDVKMISADAPVLFSKACELFVKEVTLRAWLQTPDRRRTLQRCDIARALRQNDAFSFLCGAVPIPHHKEFKDEDDGKVPKEREFPPASIHFPILDMMNAESVMRNSDIANQHQQLIFDPSTSQCSHPQFECPPTPKQQ